MDVSGAESCFEMLQRLHSTLEEYEFLVKLLKYLKKAGNSNGVNEALFYLKDEELLLVQEIASNFNISWSFQAPLDWFVFYLFARRYEHEWENAKETAVQVVTPNQNIPFRLSTLEIEQQFSTRITNVLSDLISWFSGRPLSVQFLRTYVSTMKLAEKMPRMRKHLVSHSLKWLTAALASAPELQGRRTSRRGSGCPLPCPPAQLAFLYSHASAATVTSGAAKDGENAGGGSNQPETEPSPEEALTIAIEGLILASVSDNRSGIRKLTVARLTSYLENLPFASSLLYCEKFVRICRKTPDSLWPRQDGLLRLIHHILRNWTQKYKLTCIDSLSAKVDSRENFFDAPGQFLKRRVSTALVNAFAAPKIVVQKTTQATLEPKKQPENNAKSIKTEDRIFLLEELLPSLLTLSASLVLSKRPPVRHRAALMYALAASFLTAEVQANICREILQYLRIQLQEISRKHAKLMFPSPESETHASLESLVSVTANLLSVIPNQNPSCVVLPDVCYITTLLLAHPSAGIRRDACSILTATITKLKDSQQELRNIVAYLTQDWSPNQEVLLTPMKNVNRETNSKKATAWTLGHLQAYCSVCRLLVENDLQTEAACLLAKTDMPQSRKSIWSISEATKPPSSIYVRRFTDVNALHNEKRRLSKDLLHLPSNSRPSGISGAMFKRNRSSSSASAQSENISMITKLSLLEKAEARLYTLKTLRSCSAGTSVPSSPTFFSSTPPSETSSLNDSQNGFPYSPGYAGPRSPFGGSRIRESELESPLSEEVVGTAGTRPNFDFRSSLIIIIHASIEYLCDPSRELAQLAHETLRAAGHVAGLFDRSLLSDLITTHSTFEPSLLTYGCLELLSYYVLKFAECYATHPDGTGKCCGGAATSAQAPYPALLLSGAFNIDRSRLWLRSCEHYIGTRPVSDCITLDAVRTVLGVLASLPHLGRASVELTLRGRHGTLSSTDDSEEESETNLDVDVTSLLNAVSSLEKLIEQTGQSLRIFKHPPLETDRIIGWLPDAYHRRSSLSPDHARDDVLTFASQLLYAFVQTLEAGVARCVTDPAHSSNVADLSVRPLVAASDAEIVALLLSPLLPILARWPIYLYRATLHRSASSFDGVHGGESGLHRRTIFFLMKIIWTICGCLPQSEVIVTGSQTVYTPPRRQSVQACADLPDSSLQSAVLRANTLALARADMGAVTESYLSTLLEIISSVRSQTFPASIFTSPSWWWIGQLCAVVPRLCYTAPQVDNSSLIEILCAELEQHKRSGGGDGASSRMRNENATRQRLRSSDNREDAVDAMFVRVRRRSMLPATQPTPPMQIRADRQDNRKGNKHMSEDLTGRQSNERLEDSTPRVAIAVQSPSEEEEEEEKGAEDTDFYTDDDADSEEAEVSSRRDASPASGHRSSVGNNSTEDSQSEMDCTFAPLGHDAIVKLVAHLIKLSDPGKIKPLKGQLPHEVVETVKQILESAY